MAMSGNSGAVPSSDLLAHDGEDLIERERPRDRQALHRVADFATDGLDERRRIAVRAHEELHVRDVFRLGRERQEHSRLQLTFLQRVVHVVGNDTDDVEGGAGEIHLAADRIPAAKTRRASASLMIADRVAVESSSENARPACIGTPRVAKKVAVMAPRSAITLFVPVASAATDWRGPAAALGMVVDADLPLLPAYARWSRAPARRHARRRSRRELSSAAGSNGPLADGPQVSIDHCSRFDEGGRSP